MIKSIIATQQEFESSSCQTQQYLAWFKLFKKEFTALLVNDFCIDKNDILIGNPNHFDMSGFFKYWNQWVYFRINDLRWSKDSMLIRTAKHEKDYTGGSNHYITLSDSQRFKSGLGSFLKQIQRNQNDQNS
jgi:hypothetical protein